MTLEEREKERTAAFCALDEKTKERLEKKERYARYGMDYEKIEAAEQKRAKSRAELEDLLDAYAISIWNAAWLMMAEGFENNEEGIDAFCAAHEQYQKVVR